MFTSSPRASIIESFHHHHSVFLSVRKGSLVVGGVKLFTQPNGSRGGLKPWNYGTNETDETNYILLSLCAKLTFSISVD